MKLWTNQYDLSVGYPDGSLVGTCGNKTQMEMGLNWCTLFEYYDIPMYPQYKWYWCRYSVLNSSSSTA